MNPDLKEAFSRIKPVCDLVMVCPTAETIGGFMERVLEVKPEAVQELQQYILFPFITHIKSEEMEKKYDMQIKMVDAMKLVLDRVTVNSFEMCMKIETALLSLVFDNSKPGMVAQVPEELKLSVMQCLTALMLKLDKKTRQVLLKTQVPTIAQAVFVAVHIAKQEKLRVLRLTAIECLEATTCSHPQLTDASYHIADKELELAVVDMLCNILPGVLAALQDVATDAENPGHAVVVAALSAIHRILCLAMSDKHMPPRRPPAAADFARLARDKLARGAGSPDANVSNDKQKQKLLSKRSLEWYAMAGEKTSAVARALAPLSAHPRARVRRELAVLCQRLLTECNLTMQPSVSIALDMLISLSKDEYTEVSDYCRRAVLHYMTSQHFDKSMDGLSHNLFAILQTMPRILNNIDHARKMAALNLVHGYIQILCDSARPQRLTVALSPPRLRALAHALLEAAALEPLCSMAQHGNRDVTTPPVDSPWLKPRHLDTPQLWQRLQEICALLGNAECGELVGDELLLALPATPAAAAVLPALAAAQNAPRSLAKRVLTAFTEESTWYQPLELAPPPPPADTAHQWTKDSVPGLYEGTTETRYTGITYRTPRVAPNRSPHYCATAAEAQTNLLLSCLLTEGVGIMASRLKEEFQPFMLKTLCLLLERVGSKYELLHLSGLQALGRVARAAGHASSADLIAANADYFTHQLTTRLKKPWARQAALRVLSVVMEYSDASLLDCLYAIVEHVLVQSCDKYYEKNLDLYLQVFLTFIQCIRKWFPPVRRGVEPSDGYIDIFKEVEEFVKSKELVDKLEKEEEGKSVEEMYKEDMQMREDNVLDYDDKVTEEKPPLPQHVRVTITVLKRCIHFITSTRRDQCLLSLQILTIGLGILKQHEDELFPLVHQAWGPLVGRFEALEPTVLRKGLELLVAMADCTKDFIRSRAIKEVFPHIFKFLKKSSIDSYLKDAGSVYRNSQSYYLQASTLTALPALVLDLSLEGATLTEAMACASLYLSKKQPKPLQALAVLFFKTMLNYQYGAAWLYLRQVCNNNKVLTPPPAPLALKPVTGTPYESANKDNDENIKKIWLVHSAT